MEQLFLWFFESIDEPISKALLLINDWFSSTFLNCLCSTAPAHADNRQSSRCTPDYAHLVSFAHKTFWYSSAASAIWKTARLPSVICTIQRFRQRLDQIDLWSDAVHFLLNPTLWWDEMILCGANQNHFVWQGSGICW